MPKSPLGSPLGPELDSTCEAIVLEFEKSRRAGHVFDLPNALNSIESSRRPRLAAELACIDLERSCDEGRLPVASPIVWKHLDWFESEAARAVVAVEHFRLSCVLGTPISRDAMAKLYDVAPSELPERPSIQANPVRAKNVDFPVVGETCCNYPLIAELGRGALARVYLAQQPDLAQRLVVLKVTQRATSEADKLARLQHTGIIPVYSIHKQGELTCICMPYLGALTLANLLDDGSLFSQRTETAHGLVSTIVSKRLSTIVSFVENAKEVAQQIPHASNETMPRDFAGACYDLPRFNTQQLSEQLGTSELVESLNTQYFNRRQIVASVDLITKITEALAYAHQRSIVHRDLKPENILIANDGQPILLDFNLAASVSESRCDIAGGTLPYMSPQHLRSLNNNGQALASDDVFSVGVLLYQLLSGKLPFESAPFAAQDLEKLAASRANLPKNLHKLNSAIPASLASIVTKCLALDAGDRYPSATELVEDLKRFRADQVLRYAPDRSAGEHIRKWVRRHPIITSSSSLLVCFAIIVGALVSALMLSRSRADRFLSSQQAQALPAHVGAAIALLQSPGREPALLREGITDGQAIVDKWLVDDAGGMRLKPIINRLDAPQVESVKRQLRDLLRVMSSAASQLSLSEPKSRDSQLADVARLNLLTEIVKPGLRISNDAEDTRELFYQALRAKDEKKFAIWEDLSEQMVIRQPTDPSQWFTLGAARWTLGEFESARHAFDVAEKLQPGSAIALFWHGVCELQLGNAKAAKSDFSRCLESRPAWVPAIYNRALAARMLGENDAALSDVNLLISTHQGTTRVYSLQSQLYKAAGDETRALAAQKLAIESEPQDAEDWVARGMLQIPIDVARALSDFERGLALNPTSVTALQNIAHVQSEITHQYAAATDSLTQLIHLRPNSATPIASRGIVLGRAARFEAALADAKSAETLRPNAMEMLQIAGIYSLASEGLQDRKMQGISWLSKAIALNPDLRSISATDPDFKNLQEMEQFRTLASQPSK